MLALTSSSNGPTNLSSNQVVVDALPYIDTEYEEPGMKEMVLKGHICVHFT